MILAGDCRTLEDELYSGKLSTDEELFRRAVDLAVEVRVSDGREKVWRDGDVLVGEVTEISSSAERRRRVYVMPRGYLLAELEAGQFRVKAAGVSSILILGNAFTRDLANLAIRNANGRISADVLCSIMKDVASKTASISREHTFLQSSSCQVDPASVLFGRLRADCAECGWNLCEQQ